MNELALFAGAGGGVLGSALLGWRTVCAVENDPFAQDVLAQRQNDGTLAPFPIWDDVRTFDGLAWRGRVDVVTGGFPCQPFSRAGKRQGELDERNLWPDTIRIIRAVRPHWCLLENVAVLVANPYFGTILGDLAASGYRHRYDCLPASAIGAPHQRDRVWIVAHAHGGSMGQQYRHEEEWADGQAAHFEVADAQSGVGRAGLRCSEARRPAGEQSGDWGSAASVENPNSFNDSPQVIGDEVGRSKGDRSPSWPSRPSWWGTEPKVGRMAHGVAYRVDRLKALGNGQVPAVARAAWGLLSAGLCDCEVEGEPPCC